MNVESVFNMKVSVPPSFWSDPEPDFVISCFFCKSVITFVDESTEKYFAHLQNQHDMYFNLRIILVISLMDKKKIVDFLENSVLSTSTVDNDGNDSSLPSPPLCPLSGLLLT